MRQPVRTLGVVVLIVGLAAMDPRPSFAAAVNGCPTTESALSTDITATGNGGTVTFTCPTATTIPFSSSIPITQTVTLDAGGAGGAVTFDGGGTTQLLDVSPGVGLTLRGLTLAHANLAGNEGGAIFNSGTLTITSSSFSANSAGAGGAIFNFGTLTITGSTFSGNSAALAGAVASTEGTLTITGSTFSGNSATDGAGAVGAGGTTAITSSTFSGNSAGFAGAIEANGGTLTVSASTFSRNSAVRLGGAIASATETLMVNSSTFSGNSAFDTGAIFSQVGTTAITNSTFAGNSVSNFGTMTITSSTFSGNSQAPGGPAVINLRGTLNVGGSIIANIANGGNCYGSITDTGYNLSDDSSCGFSVANHDLVDTNPQLGPLQNNGGPTQTMALLAASPAINQIPTSAASLCPILGTDQRGYARPDDGENVCDIGAYESSYTWSTTVTLTASATPAIAGQPVSFTASVTPSSGTATPTGTIQFTINGTPLGSPVPLAGGKATSLATSSLLPGSSTITATYSGNPDDLASSRSLSLQVLLPASQAGSRSTALGATPCTTVVTTASVTAGGAAAGTIFLRDERPGGSPCGATRSGALTLHGAAITELVCTSATGATIYGQGEQITAPSTTDAPVTFRADLAATSPTSALNGTVKVQTSEGYSGVLPAVVRISGC